ncbi:ATP-binding protein [Kangiella sp. HZ709]|uniref:ATP-binding protein n=1 Tax=Kangiella sp. HZ709 TaxID=2666328 RepID=UPI0012B0AAA5|nr:ATP-binding protein [Kangiella sp. HZ709]MRX27260.1 response regulator [Kangiella sp. HZ709]
MNDIASLEKKIAREIKARQEAESILESLSEELYESSLLIEKTEIKLKYALDNILDGIVVIDSYFTVSLINNQFNSIYFNSTLDLAQGDNVEEHLKDIVNNPSFPKQSNVSEQATFEIQLDASRWILCKINKTPDDLWIILVNDITWRKNAELEKSKLSKKLYQSQKQEAIGRMASVIAHDFNNILGAINGFANFLKEDLETNSELQSFSLKILSAVDRGKKIIQNLSEFNYQKISEQSSILILEVIEESIEIVQNTINQKIQFNSPDYLGKILIDGNKTQLIRLFTNLLTNSRDACHDKNAQIIINLDAHKEYTPDVNLLSKKVFKNAKNISATSAGVSKLPAGCITISIQDNGCGMSQETLDKAFEPYFTTKDKGSGTGLGMYSVFETVSQHESNITILSTPNLGTYCEVSFPIIASEVKYLPTEKTSNTPPHSNEILLVDDDQNHLEYLSTLVMRMGFKPIAHSSSYEGLKALMKSPNTWKCIISDYMMPGIKGTDILDYLRKGNTTIPFILCTGYITSEKVKALADVENVHLLEKPIDTNRLRELLESIN